MTAFTLVLTPEDLKSLYLGRFWSIRQLASLYGVSQTAIWTRLSRMGVTR